LAQEAEGAGGRLIQNASRRNEGRREAAFLFGRRLIRYFTLHRRKKPRQDRTLGSSGPCVGGAYLTAGPTAGDEAVGCVPPTALLSEPLTQKPAAHSFFCLPAVSRGLAGVRVS